MATLPEHLSADDADLDLRRRVLEPDLLRDREPDHGDAEVGTQFDLNWRGYDRHQVDAYLRTWGEDYWATKNERDALLAELEQLRAAPPTQLTPLSSMSVRLQDIVAAAEEEAAALRHETREAADAVLADAREQADADRAAAAAERSVAIGEADRVTREARELHDRLVLEAQALADRTVAEARAEAEAALADAHAEATRLVTDATTEAAEIRRVVLAEEEQVLSAARAEAEELARSTARQRDIAEAEHQRLLAAHASQQRHFSDGLRREIADLQAQAEMLVAEVERRRTQAMAGRPAPAPAAAAAVSARTRPAAVPAPPSVVPPTAVDTETAAAALDEIHALSGDPEGDVDTGELAPLDTLLHSGDTGDVFGDEVLDLFGPEAGGSPSPR